MTTDTTRQSVSKKILCIVLTVPDSFNKKFYLLYLGVLKSVSEVSVHCQYLFVCTVSNVSVDINRG